MQQLPNNKRGKIQLLNMYTYNSVKSKSVSFVRRDKLNHLMEDYAIFPIYWKYFKRKEVFLYVQMYEYKILLLNYF